MGALEGFGWGLAGGVFAELLGWFKLRQQLPSMPPVSYWIITALMVLAGGLMVLAYLRSNMPLNPLLCINIGAATPLIISHLVSQIPAVEPGRID